MIYNRDSKLCDIITTDPSVIQIINRFGVFLGVGDGSILQICRTHGIDSSLFLAIINTYLNNNYFPEDNLKGISLNGLVEYLRKTDIYYRNILLPNVERHFSLLISKSEENDNPSLRLLRKFFIEVKEEMDEMIRCDLEYSFPLINDEETPLTKNTNSTFLPFDNHTLEEKLEDLISFFVIHLRGDYDRNLCVAVVTALNTLRKDVHQNNRIRDRLLKPLCQELFA